MNDEQIGDKLEGITYAVNKLLEGLKPSETLYVVASVLSKKCDGNTNLVFFEVAKCALHAAESFRVRHKPFCESDKKTHTRDLNERRYHKRV